MQTTPFFRMVKAERGFLLVLLTLGALSFLPWWRTIHVAGMSLFGWWMAALMVLSPVGALVVFVLERRRHARLRGTR